MDSGLEVARATFVVAKPISTSHVPIRIVASVTFPLISTATLSRPPVPCDYILLLHSPKEVYHQVESRPSRYFPKRIRILLGEPLIQQ